MGPEKQSGILLTSPGFSFLLCIKKGLGEVVSKALFVLFMTEILQRFEETPPLALAQDYGCIVDLLVPLAV